MNYRTIGTFLGNVLKIESILLLFPFITALIYHETVWIHYLLVAIITFIFGFILTFRKEKTSIYYAKEGFVSVGLAWIVMGLLGCLPFIMSKEIPNFTDALFETVSGFTTTGSSILKAPEDLSHAANLWRCLTHWIGGMGVIVFMLAIFPSNSGNNMHLMRAESPGPQVGKLVPKVRQTARMLYIIYIVITLLEMITLYIAGMPFYDAFCTSVASAGTGGFGIKNDSLASYSTLIQIIVNIFILLFGVNFNVYYLLLKSKQRKDIFKMEEVKWYFLIIIIATVLISIDTINYFDNYAKSFQQASFQVATVITTTGFATTDFNLWPSFSKALLVLLMFFGACAGSTGGGIKLSRIIITIKMIKAEIYHFIHPSEVKAIKLDGKKVDDDTLRSVALYMLIFAFVLTISVLLISLDNVTLEESFTSVVATLNNIGPGLGKIGPTGNYSSLSIFSKYVLIFDMLAGRLELLPILLLLVPKTYKKI